MEKDNLTQIINLIKRNISLCDLGYLYAHNGYDDERYQELKEINMKLLNLITDNDLEELCNFYLPIKEYPTPKVEVRGMLFNEKNEILMVEEKLDKGKWSIPGGWADIGFSPKEMIIKEMKEETGLDVKVVKVLAILDKKFYDHPEEPFYTYKIVFLCEKISGELRNTFDIDDVRFFPLSSLPPLSKPRILKEQIDLLCKLINDNDSQVYCD
ncbi:NUDIX hydrolase N-terminal domain-containing protein [Fusobacterium sp. IOR10]|uniref:NUDIX hydrolase N-terminal domain-containing protein n=1 Tax=Fusobacterium sp. IOR10 TaxID=2665157 RepID=UPI0013CF650E|nr:NUDIX hydrolase N-terminal domain-containing protein [Fusobacterium sp. IOR10]